MAQVQTFGDDQITLIIHLAQISERFAALPNQLEQPTPTGLVLLVDPEVIGQLMNAPCQNGDLHFW